MAETPAVVATLAKAIEAIILIISPSTAVPARTDAS
jgi:hypothetical protein